MLFTNCNNREKYFYQILEIIYEENEYKFYWIIMQLNIPKEILKEDKFYDKYNKVVKKYKWDTKNIEKMVFVVSLHLSWQYSWYIIISNIF